LRKRKRDHSNKVPKQTKTPLLFYFSMLNCLKSLGFSGDKYTYSIAGLPAQILRKAGVKVG